MTREASPERLSPACLFAPAWSSPFVVWGAFPEPDWARSSWFFSPVLSAVQDPGLGHMGVKVSWLFDQAISTPSVSSGANKLAPYFQNRSNVTAITWPREFSASHHNTLLQVGTRVSESTAGWVSVLCRCMNGGKHASVWGGHISAVRDGGRDVRIMFRSEHKPDVGWDVSTCCVVWLNAFLLLSSFSRL